MAISERTRLAIPFVLKITLVGALGGATYGYGAAIRAGGTGLIGIERGLVGGAIIAGALSSINIWVLEGATGRSRRAPFLLHVGVKSLLYLVALIFGAAVGQRLFPSQSDSGLQIGPYDVLFCFLFSFVISFLTDLNSLLGQNVLVSFMTGRYFRPRVEQRIFLVIDMQNSTAAAERLGEVGFHNLLNRFVRDLTGPILLQRGEIHKYVGDELIVTWPTDAGLKDARCLRACFGAIQRMNELAPSYERQFGSRVRFRAGLHCGPIVIGEMGTIKKEIALLGDTLNTAARIVEACRERGEAVLASGTLLNQLAMPGDIAARSLGPVQLRGRKTPVELFALSGAADADARMR